MAAVETQAGPAQVLRRAAECTGENPALPARRGILRGTGGPGREVADKWDNRARANSAHSSPRRPATSRSPRRRIPPKTAPIFPDRSFPEEKPCQPRAPVLPAIRYTLWQSATRERLQTTSTRTDSRRRVQCAPRREKTLRT